MRVPGLPNRHPYGILHELGDSVLKLRVSYLDAGEVHHQLGQQLTPLDLAHCAIGGSCHTSIAGNLNPKTLLVVADGDLRTGPPQPPQQRRFVMVTSVTATLS